MFLDCDTTPPIRSVYAGGRSLQVAIAAAKKKLLAANAEGQIGIYTTAFGSTFHGYVIRYPGKEPYFEKAVDS